MKKSRYLISLLSAAVLIGGVPVAAIASDGDPVAEVLRKEPSKAGTDTIAQSSDAPGLLTQDGDTKLRDAMVTSPEQAATQADADKKLTAQNASDAPAEAAPSTEAAPPTPPSPSRSHLDFSGLKNIPSQAGTLMKMPGDYMKKGWKASEEGKRLPSTIACGFIGIPFAYVRRVYIETNEGRKDLIGERKEPIQYGIATILSFPYACAGSLLEAPIYSTYHGWKASATEDHFDKKAFSLDWSD